MEISPETSGVSADHRWLTETARDARWHDVELTRAFWRPAGGRWATVTAIGCKPPFRVGATQAVAHREYDGHPNHRGAAGTMTIPLPPGVRHVRRLCVAGPDNERDVTVRLWKGGFNPQARTHLRDEVVTVVIDGPGPYCETVEIHETHHPVARVVMQQEQAPSVDRQVVSPQEEEEQQPFAAKRGTDFLQLQPEAPMTQEDEEKKKMLQAKLDTAAVSRQENAEASE